MTRRPLVLMLTSFYPTEHRPHHGIFFRDHAQALAEYCDVAVLTIRTPSIKQRGQWKANLTENQTDHLWEYEAVQPVLTHRWESRISAAQEKGLTEGYRSIIETAGRQPDAVIAQTGLPCGRWAHLLKERHGIPYFVIEHFSFLQQMFADQTQEMREVYENAGALGAVSEYLQQQMHSFINEHTIHKPLERIGNVLGQSFQKQNLQDPTSGSPLRWLFVGPDDIPKKGIDILAQSIRELPESDWTLTVVGMGDYRELRSLPQASKITFQDPIPRNDMLALMQQHHALVSSSRVETFGMVIAEMLSCGRPVVATDCGGPSEILTSELGYLCQPENPVQLSENMSRMMENYSHFNRTNIRNTVLKRFGSSAFYQRVKHLFSQAEIYI
jgi:glycosyltransferase involved in cell wall biosynthesis